MESTDQLLKWYVDRTGGAFPDVTVWSAPLWFYKALMLLWALWLASRIIFVLRWGFTAMRMGGGFRTRPKTPPRNPRVALSEIEAAEAELKRQQGRSSGEGSSGPEGAGVP